MKIYVKSYFCLVLGLLLSLSSIVHIIKMIQGAKDLNIVVVLILFSISNFILGIGIKK